MRDRVSITVPSTLHFNEFLTYFKLCGQCVTSLCGNWGVQLVHFLNGVKTATYSLSGSLAHIFELQNKIVTFW